MCQGRTETAPPAPLLVPMPSVRLVRWPSPSYVMLETLGVTPSL